MAKRRKSPAVRRGSRTQDHRRRCLGFPRNHR